MVLYAADIMGAGDYTLSVSVEDKAGNTSHSASLTVTVDTQIAINNIELVNDSGIPDDNLTNNVRPQFREGTDGC